MKKSILLICGLLWIVATTPAQILNSVPKGEIRNLKIAENDGITMLEWNVYHLLSPAKFIIEKTCDGEHYTLVGEQQAYPSYFDAMYYFYDKSPNVTATTYRVRLINKIVEEEVSTAVLKYCPSYADVFAEK